MLSSIANHLGTNVRSTWYADTSDWSERIDLYRKYDAGEHRARMTEPMRRMLRVNGSLTDQFNNNYCSLVVSTMADRLAVDHVQAIGDQDAQDWVNFVMTINRWDALQLDVIEATIRDGDTFVMVSWDNDLGMPRFTHEPAFDGDEGTIPIYDTRRRNLIGAVKIWHEPSESASDAKRVNFYWADRVEKMVLRGGDFELLSVDEWTLGGEPLGVPVFHFKNRGRGIAETGQSEILSGIPLQDALNRTLVSMVMTGELSAFQIRIAKGFVPPSDLAPGQWVVIGDTAPSEELQHMSADVMRQAEIAPFIEQAYYLIDQIGTVTLTPLPGHMGGDNASGEAIKQRQVGLIGKVNRFAVKNGNVIENMLYFARRLQFAFSSTPPPVIDVLSCVWRDPAIQNQAELIDSAVKVRDAVGDREFLRLIGRVYGYDEAKVDQIIAEKSRDAGSLLAGLNLPGFSEFDI